MNLNGRDIKANLSFCKQIKRFVILSEEIKGRVLFFQALPYIELPARFNNAITPHIGFLDPESGYVRDYMYKYKRHP